MIEALVLGMFVTYGFCIAIPIFDRSPEIGFAYILGILLTIVCFAVSPWYINL